MNKQSRTVSRGWSAGWKGRAGLRGLAVGVVGLAAWMGGCAATPPTVADEAPADFSLAVVVRVPEAQADAWTTGDRTKPRAVRPARYLLESDDLLRAVIGPGGLPRTFPPPTRRLTQAQVESLWARVRDSGLLTGEAITREALGQEFADKPEPVAEPTALMVIRADGRRVYRRQVLSEGSAAYGLTDALAELAWIDR